MAPETVIGSPVTATRTGFGTIFVAFGDILNTFRTAGGRNFAFLTTSRLRKQRRHTLLAVVLFLENNLED